MFPLSHNRIMHDQVGSFKSEHYIHIMELPVNSLICNRWLMRAYDPEFKRQGANPHGINWTLEEIGSRDRQIGIYQEQRYRIPALYGYGMKVNNYQ